MTKSGVWVGSFDATALLLWVGVVKKVRVSPYFFVVLDVCVGGYALISRYSSFVCSTATFCLSYQV